LDPKSGECFRFTNFTPGGLEALLSRILAPLGFALAEPWPNSPVDAPNAVIKKLGHDEGSQITGHIFAERNLGVDRMETHRRDRTRWLAVIGGIVLGVVGLYLGLAYPSTNLRFLVLPGAFGPGIALVAALTFANADYWSDIVVAKYTGVSPSQSGDRPPASIPCQYDVQVWVVRALTQDWESKYGSGRNMIASKANEEHAAIRDAIRTGFTAPPLR